MPEYTMVRVEKRTLKELIRIGGEFTARDSYHTTHNNAILELIRFWDEHKHIEQSNG